MANDKVYIHEQVAIRDQARQKYMDHVALNWCPTGRAERNMQSFGIWGTIGSTGAWPEVILMWELDGWKALAHNFDVECNNPKLQDPALEKWWAEAVAFRRGGWDRIIVPAPYSPLAEEAAATSIRAEVYYHEIIQITPGQASTYLSLMEQYWLPVAERIGLHLVGAFRSAMVNDSEVICIWAMQTWQTWAEVETAYEQDAEVAQWRRRTQGIALDWRNTLMAAAPLSGLTTGKIP
jgi:hypothetical protein